MIKTSRQLKDKIKNLTHGDSLKSQTLLRTYMMERFLERLAVSQYNSHFVLKGGMLVSSMVGLQQRATMPSLRKPLNIGILSCLRTAVCRL